MHGRFKVDENLPEQVAMQLRDAGHDAHSVRDQGLSGATDARVLEVCSSEDRILVTSDLGFADLRLRARSGGVGIVVFRARRRQSMARTIALASRFVVLLETHVAAGQLWILDELGLRVRE